MLSNEAVVRAAFQVFAKLDRCGSLDAEVKLAMCDVLDCDPWELDAVLADANVVNEIMGTVPCSNR
jgi:hypothetical protein